MKRLRGRAWAGLAMAVLAGCAGMVAAQEPGEEAPMVVKAEALGWLEGNWRSESPDSTWEEIWTGPRAGTLVAVTRWVKDGAPKLYELSAIETGPEGLELSLRHFGPKLELSKSEQDGAMNWKLARTSERRVEFENGGGGFPQRIVYHRVADDTLDVALEGTGDDAEKKMGFRFTLVE